jgi:hypothetical protein
MMKLRDRPEMNNVISELHFVIPAKAGIQGPSVRRLTWTPLSRGDG